MTEFLILIAGFLIGWFAMKGLVMFKVHRMLKSIAEEPVQQQQIKTVDISLVKMDHAVLAYDKKTQMFLGQGATREELTEILRKRFPNTNFMVNSNNLRETYNDTTK